MGVYDQKMFFSYFSTKTYVLGTQKNRHIELVLLRTQNKCLNRMIRKYAQFYAKTLYIRFCGTNV